MQKEKRQVKINTERRNKPLFYSAQKEIQFSIGLEEISTS